MSTDQLFAGQDVQVLVPDDKMFAELLRRADELLDTLAFAYEEFQSDPEPWQFPAPLNGNTALDAMNRISTAVRPRLTVMGQGDPTGPWIYAPDGRDRHSPIRVVPLDRGDVAILEAAAFACARAQAIATSPTEPDLANLKEVLELVEDGPDKVAGIGGSGPDALGRVIAVLGPLDPDTQALTSVVAAQTGDIVLDHAQDAAYRRVVSRWTDVLTCGDTPPGHGG